MPHISLYASWLLLALSGFFSVRALFGFIQYVRARSIHGCGEPRKYPHKDPLFGIDLYRIRRDAKERGYRNIYSRRLFQENGKTFTANVFGSKWIYTMELENIQTVVTSIDNFGMGTMRQGVGAQFVGFGVVTTDGAVWEHSRALIKPIFARKQIANLHSFGTHVTYMIDLIPRDGSTVDLQMLIKRLFLDTSTQFIFGESVNSLLPSSSFDTDTFLGAFDTALILLGKRLDLGPFHYFAGSHREWKQTCRKVHSFVDRYVDKAIEELHQEKHSSTDGPSDSYTLVGELVRETQDRDSLRHQIMNVFFPARDSTAIGVSNVFFQLARHPRVWDKLRKEVVDIAPGALTIELLNSMKYLRNVINESLRLHSPVGHAARTCLKDSTLPRGGGPDGKLPIFVPKGQYIEIHFDAMQRDEDLWGADAQDFRPERWETHRVGWEYAPFLGGPRVCPAKQMVLTETAYVVVRLLQEFKGIECRDPEMMYLERQRMTTESRNGVQVALYPV